MNLTESLQSAGLSPAGDPPVVKVAVVGDAVEVGIAEVDDLVECSTTVVVAGKTDGFDPRAASLRAPGDTSISVDGHSVSVTRRLAAPSSAALYDGVHEVAKAALSVAGMIADVAELTRQVSPSGTGGTAETQPQSGEAPPPVDPSATVAAPPAVRDPESASVTDPVHLPADPVPRWWGYVQVATPILSGDAARTPLSTLEPGTWYAVVDEQGDWLQVDDGAGNHGWLGRTQLLRRE
jgi:hypothetical protein